MNGMTRVGVDPANNVIEVHGVNASGPVVTRRSLPRESFMHWCARLHPGHGGVQTRARSVDQATAAPLRFAKARGSAIDLNALAPCLRVQGEMRDRAWSIDAVALRTRAWAPDRLRDDRQGRHAGPLP